MARRRGTEPRAADAGGRCGRGKAHGDVRRGGRGARGRRGPGTGRRLRRRGCRRRHDRPRRLGARGPACAGLAGAAGGAGGGLASARPARGTAACGGASRGGGGIGAGLAGGAGRSPACGASAASGPGRARGCGVAGFAFARAAAATALTCASAARASSPSCPSAASRRRDRVVELGELARDQRDAGGHAILQRERDADRVGVVHQRLLPDAAPGAPRGGLACSPGACLLASAGGAARPRRRHRCSRRSAVPSPCEPARSSPCTSVLRIRAGQGCSASCARAQIGAVEARAAQIGVAELRAPSFAFQNSARRRARRESARRRGPHSRTARAP